MHFAPAESAGSAPGSRQPRLSTLARSHLHLGLLRPAGCVRAAVPDACSLPQRCSLRAAQRRQPAPMSQRWQCCPPVSPSAARCQPGAQPTLPGLLAAPHYSRAPRDRRGSGLLQLQLPIEVKAKLPWDALLNPKGTSLRKNPFSPRSEAGSFRLGLCLMSFAGNPSARTGTEKGQFRMFGFFLVWVLLVGGRINRHNSKL